MIESWVQHSIFSRLGMLLFHSTMRPILELHLSVRECTDSTVLENATTLLGLQLRLGTQGALVLRILPWLLQEQICSLHVRR